MDGGSADAALKSRLSLNGSGPHLRLLAAQETSLGSRLRLNGSGPDLRLVAGRDACLGCGLNRRRSGPDLRLWAALRACLGSRLSLNVSGPHLRLVAGLALDARARLVGDCLDLRGGDGVTGRCAALSVLPALTLSFGLSRALRLTVWASLAVLVGRRIGQSGGGPGKTGRRGGGEKKVALHVEGS